MDKDRFEDMWFRAPALAWPDGPTEKTVVMQKIHHEQAEVLYKAGATIYKWKSERRRQPVATNLFLVQTGGWYSYHVRACDKRELKRLHKGDVHPRTRESEKRGTVAYCVILEE